MGTRRLASLILALIPTATLHCGNAVAPTDSDAAMHDAGTLPPVDASAPDAAPSDASPVDAAAPWETASCAQVQAACGASPALVVRGHAEGLAGVDGARAEFAVRYIREAGQGLDVPHGVALGRTIVQTGALETCVCVPQGASDYPQIAAVVFAPGSTSETGRDVVRATFSQRYATLGDEDLAQSLATAPTPVLAEVALAGMSERTAAVNVTALDATAEGMTVFAGLVADERTIAAEIARGQVVGGAVALQWLMPGVAWPSESLALVVDRNGDGNCTADDEGALVRLDGRTSVAGVGTWMQGTAVQPLCDALLVQAGRQF